MCNDNPDMVRFCAANVMEGEIKRRFSYNDCTPAPGRELMKGKFQVCAPFAVYRKGFLETNDLKFLPGIYHEDNEFTPRAYYYAQKVASTDKIIYFVRQTPGSISRTPRLKRGLDLLTVIERLENFAQNQVEEDYKPLIYKQISDCINGCLKLLGSLSKEDASSLKAELLSRKKIFRLMLKSSHMTHRTEGRLIVIFPKAMKLIYNMLNIIHR